MATRSRSHSARTTFRCFLTFKYPENERVNRVPRRGKHVRKRVSNVDGHVRTRVNREQRESRCKSNTRWNLPKRYRYPQISLRRKRLLRTRSKSYFTYLPVIFFFQYILGKMLIPITLMLGIDFSECETVGRLIGLKMTVNEFVAYKQMGELIKKGKLNVSVETLDIPFWSCPRRTIRPTRSILDSSRSFH